MAKLFPFWWLNPVVTCDTVKACLEGDYSSYAIYDSFDDSHINAPDDCASFINVLDDKAVLVTIGVTSRIKVYDIATKTLGSSVTLASSEFINSTSLAWRFKQSCLNTYIAVIETSTRNLLIYKNGTLLQTLTETELGLSASSYHAISFSPRGTYIFITGTRLASGNKGWVVLVGS